MTPRRTIGGPRGALLLGLVLTALGTVWTARTLTLLERGTRVQGTVAYTTRYTIGIRHRPQDRTAEFVSLPKPSLALPGTWRPGQEVAIVLDTTVGEEPLLPVRGVFFPMRARLDSSFRLWTAPVLALAFGALCLGLYALSMRHPRSFRVSTRLQWGGKR